MQALADDDERARVIAERDRGRGSVPDPLLSEWSAEVDLLAQLTDRIGLLLSVYASAHGADLKLPPIARPRTAMDRARDNWAREQHRKLTARLLPHQQQDGGFA